MNNCVTFGIKKQHLRYMADTCKDVKLVVLCLIASVVSLYWKAMKGLHWL